VPLVKRSARGRGLLIANEKRDRLELLAKVVIGLGRDVIAREIYVKEVGAVTARERPDVALVEIGATTRRLTRPASGDIREGWRRRADS
jgi:hypothetical protein